MRNDGSSLKRRLTAAIFGIAALALLLSGTVGLFTLRAQELTAARGAIKKLGGEYRETRTLHLPGGDTRTLILCKKISQTPTAYPRNGGKIAKSPLK